MTVYPYINYGLNPMICGFIRFHVASWHGIAINHQPAWRSSWRSPLSSWLLSPPHKSHGFWLVSTLKQWGSPSCITYIYICRKKHQPVLTFFGLIVGHESWWIRTESRLILVDWNANKSDDSSRKSVKLVNTPCIIRYIRSELSMATP